MFGVSVPSEQDLREKTDCNHAIDLPKILRQAICLLRYLSFGNGQSVAGCWLPRDNIEKVPSAGFSRHILNFDSKLFMGGDTNQNLQHRLLNYGGRHLLDKLFQRRWFNKFVSDSLDKKYPLERFAIWMAVFVIAKECNHEQVQSVCAEMFEQMFHQETNSAITEELLQLRQLGSVCLSYYKRFSDAPIIKDLHTELGEAGVEDCDDDPIDVMSGVDDNLHLLLRRILNKELFKGVECEICRHQPSEVLEPLKWSCPNGCRYGRQGSLVDIYCSSSFRAIEMIPLSAVVRLRPNVTRILLLSSKEWARKFVSQIQDKQTALIESRANLIVEERIDISSRFQRLTMLRRQDGPGYCDDDDSNQSDNTDEDSLTESTGATRSEDLLIFNRFIKSGDKTRISTGQDVTESVKVIRFLKDDQSVRTVPLCRDELFIADSIDNCNVVALYINMRRSLWSYGKIWHCRRRSQVSNLMIGCGRYFQSIELTLLGKGSLSGSSDATCPNCGQDIQVLSRFGDSIE